VGYNGYVTIPDAAALELGNNFEIEQYGYIDTSAGADKNLIIKTDAFRTYISATDNITSEITTTFTGTLRPSGLGDDENMTTVVGGGVGTHYLAVDDVASDEDATYVQENNAAY